jgi:rod shape determining protein RodA
VQRQLLWVAVALLAAEVVARSDYRRWRAASWLIYATTVLLLVAVLIVGMRIMGARRWLMVGGASLQPAELAKLGVIVMLSWWAWRCASEPSRDRFYLGGAIPLAVIPLGLVFIEPALGTTVTMLFALGVLSCTVALTWRGLALLASGAVVCAILVIDAYHVRKCFVPVPHEVSTWVLRLGLKPYQIRRLRGFLHRSPDNVFVGGANEVQALITLGRGGLFGHGPGGAMQITHGYLPRLVSHNDFAICTLAEIGGFALAGGVVLMELGIVFWCLQVAFHCPDRFGRGVCVGIAGLFFVHVAVPLAVALRLCPATGLPIYLVSSGGSAMLTAMLGLGIVRSVQGHSDAPVPPSVDRSGALARLVPIRAYSIGGRWWQIRLIYAE